jgi:hypothetical protein
VAFYYFGTFGHSHSGKKGLWSRFIVAAIATTAMIFAAATAPNATKYRCNMEFPRRINSHLAEFVSKM